MKIGFFRSLVCSCIDWVARVAWLLLCVRMMEEYWEEVFTVGSWLLQNNSRILLKLVMLGSK